jgi:VanZ family protein
VTFPIAICCPRGHLAREVMLTCVLLAKYARIASWLLAASIVVLSLVPPSLRPVTELPHDVEHFAIFGATGLAYGLGYSRQYFVVAAALLIFTGAIEVAQMAVPGRHARLSDFMVDALAVCIGVVTASVRAPSNPAYHD